MPGLLPRTQVKLGERWIDFNYRAMEKARELNGTLTSTLMTSADLIQAVHYHIIPHLRPQALKVKRIGQLRIFHTFCSSVSTNLQTKTKILSRETLLPDFDCSTFFQSVFQSLSKVCFSISTCSLLNCAGWRIEAWRRMDPRIGYDDILDRMVEDPSFADGEGLIKPNTGSLSNQCHRKCRKLLSLAATGQTRDESHKTTVEALENLTWHNIRYNTILPISAIDPERIVKLMFVKKNDKNSSSSYKVKAMAETPDNLHETTLPIDYFLTDKEKSNEEVIKRAGREPRLPKKMDKAFKTLLMLQERAMIHGFKHWSELGKDCVPRTWNDRVKEKDHTNEVVDLTKEDNEDTKKVEQKETFYDGGCEVCTWRSQEEIILGQKRRHDSAFPDELESDQATTTKAKIRHIAPAAEPCWVEVKFVNSVTDASSYRTKILVHQEEIDKATEATTSVSSRSISDTEKAIITAQNVDEDDWQAILQSFGSSEPEDIVYPSIESTFDMVADENPTHSVIDIDQLRETPVDLGWPDHSYTTFAIEYLTPSTASESQMDHFSGYDVDLQLLEPFRTMPQPAVTFPVGDWEFTSRVSMEAMASAQHCTGMLEAALTSEVFPVLSSSHAFSHDTFATDAIEYGTALSSEPYIEDGDWTVLPAPYHETGFFHDTVGIGSMFTAQFPGTTSSAPGDLSLFDSPGDAVKMLDNQVKGQYNLPPTPPELIFAPELFLFNEPQDNFDKTDIQVMGKCMTLPPSPPEEISGMFPDLDADTDLDLDSRLEHYNSFPQSPPEHVTELPSFWTV